jgi:transcription elongation factor/antiterminator RfaH
MTNGANNSGSWFLIHTHPKQEERTIRNLEAWSVETLSPLIRDWRYDRFTGERTPIVKPLFSRYVFARFDLYCAFHKIRYARGVHEVVSFGSGPVEIDDAVIDLIRSRIGRDGFVIMDDDLKPGDKIVIKDGVLRDLTGVFERGIKASNRVVLLLNTVNYQARVKIEREYLNKLSASGCPA